MYNSACLRGIWTPFYPTNMLWHHAGLSVKLQLCGTWCWCHTCLPFFSLNHFFPCISFYPPVSSSVSLSLWALVLFSSLIFPSLSPLIFPIILLLFPIFPKTGFAASSASRILFRCQIKIPGKSAILSQQWNKSRTLRVIWRRMTQIPPLALEQTWGLKLKGRYVAGVRGLFGFVHTLVGCSQAFHSYYSVMILICVFV